ncbi:MAG: phosphoglycerate kinase [bacterium]|nr:phosphoglycerate kinase [bacterium]
MSFNLKKLEDLSDLAGKKTVVRVGFDVPVGAGRVLNDFRIKKTFPAMEFLARSGARSILLSHRRDEKKDDTSSLLPVFEYLKNQTEFKISFAKSLSEAKDKIRDLRNGQFILVENIRREKGEKENSADLSKKIAELGHVFVNEAFSVSHREHCSVVGVARLMPSYAGPLFLEEVENLSRAFKPTRPFLFLMGGAKFKTKLHLVEKFMQTADTVFVGGALANDIFSAKGMEVGLSPLAKEKVDLANVVKSSKVLVPKDVLVENLEGRISVKKSENISKDETVRDVGPETLVFLRTLCEKASFIIWNGPLGFYEKGFSGGTEKLAGILGRVAGDVMVGGGDTLAAVSSLGIHDKFSFVSTGGGAMLKFLSDETLPGIKALEINGNF